MSYFYIVAVLALLYGGMHFFTGMTHRQKLQVTGGLLIIVAAAIAYNRMTDRTQAHVREMLLRFNQHDSLECGGVRVNDANFTLSVGTQSFIAHEGTQHAGQIFDAADCR